MEKFSKDDILKILDLVGGKENILEISHCVTRMRFVLKDEKKANSKKIEEMEIVIAIINNSGEFQLLIGAEVKDFYNEFMNITGLNFLGKEKPKKDSKPSLFESEDVIDIIDPLLEEEF